eukprot:CAMPEP_0184390114 /NCGR_PEP_ID=MMETSP0007-20130409/13074_1 /TAXON_ID=97485 /ORGANISM="Prymnesium parvum, Strain Texoma1" /LENGTH=78 /DNA_ID=CAMNT_0026739747 /DNA_START=1 /DNA_END=235 /DNA_ORIENTATION=-
MPDYMSTEVPHGSLTHICKVLPTTEQFGHSHASEVEGQACAMHSAWKECGQMEQHGECRSTGLFGLRQMDSDPMSHPH